MWMSGLPQSSSGFASDLQENEQADTSANKYGSALDGIMCLDSSIRIFAGYLRDRVGDAFSKLLKCKYHMKNYCDLQNITNLEHGFVKFGVSVMFMILIDSSIYST